MRSKREATSLNNLRLSSLIGLYKIGLIVLLCTINFSCDTAAVYEQYISIEDAAWEKEKEILFTFEVEDSSVPYNLSVQVRNNNLYPYQNLWLFAAEEQPNGLLRRDTIECMLADDFGKWYGNGVSLFQSSFPVRTNYTFPSEGEYTFRIRQGMRKEVVPGIQEIGFRVEKAR